MPAAASETPPRPLRRIRPPQGWGGLDLAEVWEFRDLLLTLVGRDLKLRYRQTALGVGWVVLQPLIAAGIFTFVFGAVAGLSSNDTPYFALTLAGQVAWTAFALTLNRTSTSLLFNGALITKIYFPRLILPLSTLLSTAVDVGIGLLLLALLLLVYQITPTLALLSLPLWLLLLAGMGLGVGLFAAALVVRYRDINLIVPVVLQFLTFASPVGWSLTTMSQHIPPRFQTIYFLLNPAAPLLEAFRWSLLGRGSVPWPWVGYSGGMVLLLLLGGIVVFRRQEREFADVI
jgi:lipopolysaccharide transport system permease protein